MKWIRKSGKQNDQTMGSKLRFSRRLVFVFIFYFLKEAIHVLMRICQDFNQTKKKNSNHSAAFTDLQVNGSYDQCLKVLRSLTNVLKIGASLPQPLTPISNTQIFKKKKVYRRDLFIT